MTDGYAPDGDTIRFRPERPSDLGRLAGVERLRAGRDGTVVVRLEGVDAPETHYLGVAQPRGEEARDALSRGLGVRGGRGRGAVVARSVDVRGRVVAYVFADGEGDVEGLARGDDLRALASSANVRLLEEGAAYPLLYRYLEEGTRESFRSWLARVEDDGVLVEGRAQATRLSRILAEEAAAVRVTVDLTRLTFVER